MGAGGGAVEGVLVEGGGRRGGRRREQDGLREEAPQGARADGARFDPRSRRVRARFSRVRGGARRRRRASSVAPRAVGGTPSPPRRRDPTPEGSPSFFFWPRRPRPRRTHDSRPSPRPPRPPVVRRTPPSRPRTQRYGSAYLVTSISLSIVSISVCYALVGAGVDVAALLDRVGLHVTTTSTQARSSVFTLVPVRPRRRCELHYSLRTDFSSRRSSLSAQGPSLSVPTRRDASFDSASDASRLRPDVRRFLRAERPSVRDVRARVRRAQGAVAGEVPAHGGADADRRRVVGAGAERGGRRRGVTRARRTLL